MVKYWLKPGTVPTIFPWGKVKTPTTSVTSNSASSSSSPVDTAETVKQTIAQIMAETAELNKAAGIEPVKEESTGTTSKRSSIDSSGIATKVPRTSIDANVSSTSIQDEPSFTAGTKIEAQDFAGLWHTAKVIEVDTDEKEVFIKYEKTKNSKAITMSDEWIPMNSSRLRSKQSSNRPVLTYVEGEKCLAKWQARKFPATVTKVFGNDLYEVIFDDGYFKTLKAHMMSKSKVGTPQTPETKKASTSSVAVAIKKEAKEKEWNLISMSSLNMGEFIELIVFQSS